MTWLLLLMVSPPASATALTGNERLSALSAEIKNRLGAVTVTLAMSEPQPSLTALMQETLGPIQLAQFGILSSQLTVCVTNGSLSQEVSTNFWNPDFYYLFHFVQAPSNNKTLFSYMWDRFRIYKLLVTDWSTNSVVTFDPVTRTCQHTLISHLSDCPLFTNKFPNFKQSPFHAVFAGLYVARRYKNSRSFLVDRLTLDEIAQRLNLSLEIVNSTDPYTKFGERSENGTFHGTFKELVELNGNMTANAHFLKMYNIQDKLVYTVYVKADKICIAVPKTKMVPRYEESFKAFNLTVWLSIGLIYIMTAGSLKLMWKLSGSPTERCLPLTMFGICLGLPVEFWPKKHYERLLLSALLLVSLVVVSVVQSTLNAILSTPPSYYRVPSSREEFNEQHVLLWTSSPILISEYQAAGYTEMRFHLKTEAEKKMDLFQINYDVAIFEKVAAVIEPLSLEFLREKMQMTASCAVQHNIAYVLQRGSPFQRPLNRLLQDLVQGGVILYWDRLVYLQPFRSMQFMSRLQFPTELRALSLEDLSVPFGIASIGFLLALLCFILEMVIYQYKKTNVHLEKQIKQL